MLKLPKPAKFRMHCILNTYFIIHIIMKLINLEKIIKKYKIFIYYFIFIKTQIFYGKK